MRNVTLRGLFAAFALVLAVATFAPAPAYANATLVIINGNAAGVGFNDPTVVAPVGGNPGTTLGQQRLNAFQFAADIWGATLDSNVPIQVLATFEPLACNATGATLGSAGTRFIVTNFGSVAPFPGPEFANHWYSQALSDKRAGADTIPGEADIRARFNINLGNPGCLTGIGWYLGFDANAGTQIDLVTVLLHEFGHGLGFQQFASLATGAMPSPAAGLPGIPDVYNRNLLDTTANKLWPVMTNAERLASSINSRHVVWVGNQVTTEMPSVLAQGTPNMHVNAPAAIAGDYAVGTATFGNQLTASAITGNIVQGIDPANAAGPSTTDGCSPLTNAAAVAGNVCFVDRGTCGFIVKAANCQAAGAIAMVVADNAAGSPPAGLGGADPTLTIPSVRITLPDGNTIKAQLGAGVNVSLLLDMSLRSGADSAGHVHVNAPNPVVGGSSISHWDPITFPNQLMEPAINSDLTHSLTGVDLTLAVMRDIGWYPDADVDGIATAADNCPNNANGDQADLDGDNVGDVCDADDDGDGVDDGVDNCPVDANSDQANNDGDGQGDVCDPDDDNDGVADGADNCPFASNADQADNDADGAGDACDADDDNDGVDDATDNCPFTANANQADFDLDNIGDACDPHQGPPQNMDQCKNGQHVRFDVPIRFPNQGQCVCYTQASDFTKCAAIKK
ncbi:MAG TPA: thrombospondin type 3 repeat-containing protein [Candidatus Polarisedimenticolia bacterium]|nr:thrombospondin type 3 repeat-containing protein [Candidatus Polarisedimenticolia bacterium]